jgi:hypothetical protein
MSDSLNYSKHPNQWQLQVSEQVSGVSSMRAGETVNLGLIKKTLIFHSFSYNSTTLRVTLQTNTAHDDRRCLPKARRPISGVGVQRHPF